MPHFDDPEAAREAGRRSGEVRRERAAQLPAIKDLLEGSAEELSEKLLEIAMSDKHPQQLAAISLAFGYLYGRPRAGIDATVETKSEESAINASLKYLQEIREQRAREQENMSESERRLFAHLRGEDDSPRNDTTEKPTFAELVDGRR